MKTASIDSTPEGSDSAKNGLAASEISAPVSPGLREGQATRRTFTNEYKRRVVAEYEAAPHGEKGALLRRKKQTDRSQPNRQQTRWRVETYEDGVLAAELVEDIVTEQEIRPGYLHADRGAAMTSKPLSSLLSDLDVTRSHSRPRVSNDNPYSEAQFKTMKYVPDYPERFASVGEARTWMDRFVGSYNHEHRHSGIGY